MECTSLGSRGSGHASDAVSVVAPTTVHGISLVKVRPNGVPRIVGDEKDTFGAHAGLGQHRTPPPVGVGSDVDASAAAVESIGPSEVVPLARSSVPLVESTDCDVAVVASVASPCVLPGPQALALAAARAPMDANRIAVPSGERLREIDRTRSTRRW